MSTGDKTIKPTPVQAGRFAQLARLSEVVFHAKDLANLWKIRNANTLHTTLKRYTAQGLLLRVYKGLYAMKPVDHIDPLLLGVKALHRYAYITTETVLCQSGIIFQQLPWITLASSVSKQFTISGHAYRVRKFADRFLFQEIGTQQKNGVRIASPERAAADLLHVNPHAYLDAPQRLNWNMVREIQTHLGYTATTHV